MATGHRYILSTQEVEAISKALEHAGVGSGNWHTMLETFGNAETAKAAKRIRNALRNKVARAVSRNVEASSDILHEEDEQDRIEEEKERFRAMAADVRKLRGALKDHLMSLETIQRALENEHDELVAAEVAQAIQSIKHDLDY